MMGIISPTDEIISKPKVGLQRAVETLLALLRKRPDRNVQ